MMSLKTIGSLVLLAGAVTGASGCGDSGSGTAGPATPAVKSTPEAQKPTAKDQAAPKAP
jgi:hypothetical protein